MNALKSFKSFLKGDNFFQQYLNGKDIYDFNDFEYARLTGLLNWHRGDTRNLNNVEPLVGMRKKYPNELVLPNKYRSLYRVTLSSSITNGTYRPKRKFASFTTSVEKARAFTKYDRAKESKVIIEIAPNPRDFVINPDFFDALIDKEGSFFIEDHPESETLYIKTKPLKVIKQISV